jgi:hypothetical protein
MATVYNIAVDQGSDYTTTINLTDDAGANRNLTSFTARGQMKRNFSSTSNIAFTTAISNPTGGEVIISLSNAKTANLKYGRYVYDVELVNTGSGNVERILEGIVTVYPEVTK